jgi:hypothetical protein
MIFICGKIRDKEIHSSIIYKYRTVRILITFRLMIYITSLIILFVANFI